MSKRTVLIVVVILGIGAIIAAVLYDQKGGTGTKPKVAIFNLLSHPILDDSIAGIKDGLAEDGYGREAIEIIEINANGEMDKLNAFATELLSTHPDVIVPVSTPVTQAVFKEASLSQKIVFSTVTNPSDVGMDTKPKNMTGVCDAVNYEANFDLMLELFPQTTRIGIIYNAGERNSQYGVDQVKRLAQQRSVELRIVTVSQSQEVVDAARSLIGNVDVIYVGSDNTVVAAMAGLTRVAYEAKLPVIASDSGSVRDGALAAVSVDYRKLGEQVGHLVAQVLRTGQMPEDAAPIIFLGDRLMLNTKAASQIGFRFPPQTREQAAEIVE
mgnify:CR=1 FL=1